MTGHTNCVFRQICNEVFRIATQIDDSFLESSIVLYFRLLHYSDYQHCILRYRTRRLE